MKEISTMYKKFLAIFGLITCLLSVSGHHAKASSWIDDQTWSGVVEKVTRKYGAGEVATFCQDLCTEVGDQMTTVDVGGGNYASRNPNRTARNKTELDRTFNDYYSCAMLKVGELSKAYVSSVNTAGGGCLPMDQLRAMDQDFQRKRQPVVLAALKAQIGRSIRTISQKYELN